MCCAAPRGGVPSGKSRRDCATSLGRPGAAAVMTFSIHGLAVARGIAIGRAVLVASSRMDVAHYFIDAAQVEAEIDRVRMGRNAVVDEIHRLKATISNMSAKEAPHE